MRRPPKEPKRANMPDPEFAFVPAPPPSATLSPPTWYFERQVWDDGYLRVAGADEAGRGCLAGPVVAAAVILDPQKPVRGLRDSKLLDETERLRLADRVRERSRAWAIGICSPDEIDTLNILWASMEAMRRAVEALPESADYLLIDGNQRIPGAPCPSRSIIKGDARSRTIAAASILAKTYRDALMRGLHEAHPDYGWDSNVGYPTPEHYRALDLHGPTSLHRRSFRLSTEPPAQVTCVELFTARGLT
jgi:ribonuclease HII